jgi:hypothetical protein
MSQGTGWYLNGRLKLQGEAQYGRHNHPGLDRPVMAMHKGQSSNTSRASQRASPLQIEGKHGKILENS